MRLAVNYSAEAARLLRRGEVEVDLFKCPDWPDVLAAAASLRPAYVHFPLRAGDGSLAGVDLERVAHLREETGTPFVNVHLGADPAALGLAPAEDGPVARARLLEAWRRDVGLLCDRFGADAVIVENVIWRPGPVPRAAVDPDAISSLAEEIGCGLLLDLSHARLSAHALGLPAAPYLEALPVGRLRELHVTGIGLAEGLLQDHLELSSGDWRALGAVLARIRSGAWRRPEVVALEYGGLGPVFAWRSDEAALRTQLRELGARLDASAPSPTGPPGTSPA